MNSIEAGKAEDNGHDFEVDVPAPACFKCDMNDREMARNRCPDKFPDTTNPKDAVGRAKVSLSLMPSIAVAVGAMAMMDGAQKYGPYNWRDKDVSARVYVDAAMRHLQCWLEGQEAASDSGVHHLGHAIACCAILVDAQALGKLLDDRPVVQEPGWYESRLAGLAELNKARQATKG